MTDKKILILTEKQIAELWDGEKLIKTYSVSTALKGLSCQEGSLGTPTGQLRVAQKIGSSLPLGAVLRGRVPTGEIWSQESSNPLRESVEDLVLTRVLWLEGLEAVNANTLERYIYLHGTNHEELLGTPASHGCIRLRNEDIVDLFDRVEVGTAVEVRVS